MLYFKNLPVISYPDGRGNNIYMKDLTTRVYIVSQLIKSPLSYYEYTLKEKDTPEIVAEKYYGSADDYWLVMVSNLLNDPQWDWPLSQYNLNKYILQKYGSYEEANKIHHYEKITTYTDPLTGEKQETITTIGKDEYDTLIPFSRDCVLPSGETVKYSLSKSFVTNYTYEVELNDSKQIINLINVSVANELKRQLKTLYGNV